jgi:hypothetical protein
LLETPDNLCKNKAAPLLPFMKEVFSYKFEETPNYAKLRQLLVCILLKKNIVPTKCFDWSKFTHRDLRSKSQRKEALLKFGDENVKHDEAEEFKSLNPASSSQQGSARGRRNPFEVFIDHHKMDVRI